MNPPGGNEVTKVDEDIFGSTSGISVFVAAEKRVILRERNSCVCCKISIGCIRANEDLRQQCSSLYYRNKRA